MGVRAVRLILLWVCVMLAAVPCAGCSPMRGPVTDRESAAVARPLPRPTQEYDGAAPPPADRRPVEQNPTCWIASPGWPRCSERTDTP